MASSDARIEEFRSRAGLLQGENSTLAAQELSELNTQITLAEAVRTEAQAAGQIDKEYSGDKGHGCWFSRRHELDACPKPA